MQPWWKCSEKERLFLQSRGLFCPGATSVLGRLIHDEGETAAVERPSDPTSMMSLHADFHTSAAVV